MEPTKPSKVQVPDDQGLAHAAQVIAQGGTVAVPTETVYGLAARADQDAAVAGIYRAKGRPDFNPLIVHVPDVTAARGYALFDDRALALAEAFWPGALTMVLPRRSDARLAAAVSAGLPTVALRVPAHPVMQALLKTCGYPLAAPSANRSGGVSPTSAAHVADSLAGRVDLILDGGETERGIESTIVGLRDDGTWALLRPGPIPEAEIAAVLGQGSTAVHSTRIEAPGQLASHYAPGKPVRLNAMAAQEGEFLIGFGAVGGDVSLSASGDLAEAAARLYACLHLAAAAPEALIAVAPIPDEGIGTAINDRLRRAAA
ncbi:MAG: threonylcarbamoyl-AMP synthase [Novosphingobium sp. 28-62-57]|uniref:L-threonylcarbamoyladenylate synthase n=1 Tax=unclassified Novosphingobium TaxID=2644732 RepID=UPI000BDC237F|nr:MULTISPECIES: L-threonylcarbamoyladenylate synthase [unclassified Novosphingobium]OYW50246.1 MAG: threonylcarbamoyl-AMP synthase [Novosphingobium sp. 12-62-10]OYZ11649.1 MAG: threonylcarbamoyl-AMP synthase [Novosphingobium sp. 28-62-57]OYZ97496.1 MAG: threonylcarbamoyl-AMP synthase [Novosphingobium sp. 17-62-8]HQS68824.1 L-threonylcarbamoyladenylate synthase [Novosphingobium sp.]